MGSRFIADLDARVKRQRKGRAYANYLRVRDYLGAMMDDWVRLDPDGGPSAYWKEEIEGFLYLFDASPMLVEHLREQCYHITGIKSYEYRTHHQHQARRYMPKYKLLRKADPTVTGANPYGLFVPEADALGGFGLDIGANGKANIDTLKFYEVLIGMEQAGLLPQFRGQQSQRKVVLEIGSGWGGFAYQFKTLAPNTTYICLDLPPTMIFSGVYLTTLFPEAKALFYGEKGFDKKIKNYKDYDFIFVPHYYWAKLQKQVKLDLGINMVSFQEMTTAQVDGYARGVAQTGAPIYSLNRDRSKNNDELTTVTEILADSFELTPVHVLDLQYIELKAGGPPTAEVHRYRHYLGTPK
ncbi:MAG: hypothetical protein BGN86_12645 [Caulobacterales bacterium 68-7]|nr:MAG: hypothetical protein BGN86_12645 [Caulobacterales bacterium 68-7]